MPSRRFYMITKRHIIVGRISNFQLCFHFNHFKYQSKFFIIWNVHTVSWYPKYNCAPTFTGLSRREAHKRNAFLLIYNTFDATFGIWLNSFFQSPTNIELCASIILCRHRPVLEIFLSKYNCVVCLKKWLVSIIKSRATILGYPTYGPWITNLFDNVMIMKPLLIHSTKYLLYEDT